MTLPMSHSMATLYSEVNAFLPVTFCRCNEPSIPFVHCKTYQSSRIAAHWSHLHSRLLRVRHSARHTFLLSRVFQKDDVALAVSIHV